MGLAVLAACGGGGGGGAPAPAPVPNQSPSASAGADIQASLSSNGINLDGSASSDPDGDALQFSWAITSLPSAGAVASLDDANTANPTLQTLVPGVFEVELTVTDGRGGSSTDSVTLDLQNDAPVILLDAVRGQLAIGESVTLNPTGSTDPNGHPLTFDWTLTTAPASSNLISSFPGAAPIVAFDIAGTFELTVEVSDGYATVSEQLSFTVDEFVKNDIAKAFTYLETDANSSVIAVAENDSVSTIDADGIEVGAFALGNTVIDLAVSPDGAWIGAAHLDSVSMIRMSDGAVMGPWPVPTQPGDLIIDNSGFVHVMPRTGQWIQFSSVDPSTGAITSSAGGPVRAGTIVKVHPDGMKAYGANNGLSPSDIERYDLSSGTISLAYDSPYHGDYPFSGNLWISEDGRAIIAASGVVVRATDTRSTDMTFVMQLARRGVIKDAAYEASMDQWYLVEDVFGVIELNVYDGSGGHFIQSMNLPELVAGTGSAAVPTQIVSDPNTRTIRIFATDHPTNPQNYAVFKRAFIDRNLLDYPPVVRMPSNLASFTDETVTLDATDSFDPEGEALQFSWSLDSEPAMSALVLPPLDTAQIQFVPVVAGDYVFTLTVSDGERVAQPHTVTVRVVEPGNVAQLRLTGAPSDIVYNKPRHQILYTSSTVAELRIRDLADSSEQIVALDRIGERLDVSPNGNYAVVAHAGSASLIDLSGAQAAVIDTQAFSADWGDIVVDDRAIAYLIPNRDQWVDMYAIDFGNDRVTSRFGARASTQLRMHPQGGKVYAADRGLSPSDIEKWTVSNIDSISYVDSPYHGTYGMGGNIWINETGDRLIVAGGHVFRASDDPNLDMNYVATLPAGLFPNWADHSDLADMWAIASANIVTLITDTTYSTVRTVSVEPPFFDPANTSPVVDQVYFSSAGDTVVVVAHSDQVSMDQYVVQISNLSP